MRRDVAGDAGGDGGACGVSGIGGMSGIVCGGRDGVSPNIHPPLKVVSSRDHDWFEGQSQEFRCPNMSCRSGVFPIEFRYQVRCVDLIVRFPGIMFNPEVLPLYQIAELPVNHLAV